MMDTPKISGDEPLANQDEPKDINSQGMQEGESKSDTGLLHDFATERYRFILQQIHTANENVYRFLAIYQTLMTALVGAQIVVFVNYKRWALPVNTGRSSIIVLLLVETMVALFAALLIVTGILTWFDYRNEECDLTDQLISADFRRRPSVRHLFRWYETYIVAFIIASIALVWWLCFVWMLPNIRLLTSLAVQKFANFTSIN